MPYFSRLLQKLELGLSILSTPLIFYYTNLSTVDGIFIKIRTAFQTATEKSILLSLIGFQTLFSVYLFFK